jgi:hypothetical protein
MLKLSREGALFAVGGAPGLLVDMQVLMNFPRLQRRPVPAMAPARRSSRWSILRQPAGCFSGVPGLSRKLLIFNS